MLAAASLNGMGPHPHACRSGDGSRTRPSIREDVMTFEVKLSIKESCGLDEEIVVGHWQMLPLAQALGLLALKDTVLDGLVKVCVLDASPPVQIGHRSRHLEYPVERARRKTQAIHSLA